MPGDLPEMKVERRDLSDQQQMVADVMARARAAVETRQTILQHRRGARIGGNSLNLVLLRRQRAMRRA